MVLKLYCDLMSQPSRALYILFKVSNVPFETKLVDLRQAAHLSSDYEKINRFQKVPVIDHNGFLLTESVAIVKYLAGENIIPEKYYPKNTKAAARVDEFLSWHHIGIRAPCALYFRSIFIDPLITGKPTNPERVAALKERMCEALDLIEEKWLGTSNKYITGDKLTAADIFACCEIEQPRMVGYDPKEGRPNLAAWMDRVKAEIGSYYEEGHVIVNKVINKRASKL